MIFASTMELFKNLILHLNLIHQGKYNSSGILSALHMSIACIINQYNHYQFLIEYAVQKPPKNKMIEIKIQRIELSFYSQRRLKTAITIDEDRLSYFQNLSFKFDANASFPRTETEEIVITNLPLMVSITDMGIALNVIK